MPSKRTAVQLIKKPLFSPAGSAEEQAAAATVFTLLCIQLGGGDEAEEGFKMLRPVLTAILLDNTANVAVRQSVSYHINLLDIRVYRNPSDVCMP